MRVDSRIEGGAYQELGGAELLIQLDTWCGRRVVNRPSTKDGLVVQLWLTGGRQATQPLTSGQVVGPAAKAYCKV